METPHIPVLFHQTMEVFKEVEAGSVVDCTMGYGGHSEGLLQAYPHIKLIGIDRDREAIDFSTNRLAKFGERFRAVKGRFSDVLPTLKEEKITGVLADIGVSSLQLDKAERGFGFGSESLDMRMDPEQPLDAAGVVNGYSAGELERIFREYGEEKAARKLADAIVKHRPFSSAKELAERIETVVRRSGKIHPATKIFQAIRIEVNDELGELERMLDGALELARPGMILAVITFHSLEDRIVKNRFREWGKDCICPPEAPRCVCGKNHAQGKAFSSKPMTATSEELKENSRSRSAKLRAFRFEKGRP